MPKRRDHGQGAIFYLSTRSLWRGVIDDGFTASGGRRQRYVHAKTREECVKKLRTLMQEIAQHGRPLDHRARVSDLAERWLADASGRLKPKTMQGYRSHVSTSIVPILGKRVVSELTPSDVRRLHTAIFARNVGPASVAGAHRTLSAMLAYAVDEGGVARNVAESVDIPRQAPTDRDSLTRSEAEALMRLGNARWNLELLSGARDGEIRGLRVTDLDLEKNLARISWALTEVTFLHGCAGACGAKVAGRCPARVLDIAPNLEAHPLQGRWVLLRPKAYRPRIVPLTPAVSTALRTHLESAAGPNPHQLVWHRADGSPLTNSDSNAAFRDSLRAAGIKRDATTHWLRHTYTTMAEHAGIPWAAYAGISGHATEDISRRYTHQLEQEARSAVETLDAFLSSAEE